MDELPLYLDQDLVRKASPFSGRELLAHSLSFSETVFPVSTYVC